MVIRELVAELKSKLKENSEFEAKEIVMSVMNITQTELVINSGNLVSDSQYKEALSLLSRRLKGEPLQYILGKSEFMSLPFELNRDTLIPRSDTETLVEEIIKHIGKRSLRVLDIGTGSGCIGISIAKYTPAKVTLADINANALKMAKHNAKINNVAVDTINIDILKEIPKGKFDVIVSNPPYIRTDVIDNLQTEVKDFEPSLALDGGKDGLMFYRRITEIAPEILVKDGILAYEIGYDQGEAVKELMSSHFSNVEIIKDLCANDRVVIGRKADV